MLLFVSTQWLPCDLVLAQECQDAKHWAMWLQIAWVLLCGCVGSVLACGSVYASIEVRELLSTRLRAQVTYPPQRDHGRTVTRRTGQGRRGPGPQDFGLWYSPSPPPSISPDGKLGQGYTDLVLDPREAGLACGSQPKM